MWGASTCAWWLAPSRGSARQPRMVAGQRGWSGFLPPDRAIAHSVARRPVELRRRPLAVFDRCRLASCELPLDPMLGAIDAHHPVRRRLGRSSPIWPWKSAALLSASPPCSAAATAAGRRCSCASAGAPSKPFGYSSAMKPVVMSPERKRGWSISADRKSRLLPMPSIWKPSSAPTCASIAASRVGAQLISLAIIGS